MKKYISDNELLSAYIDGELSVEEKNQLEQRLSYSPELKKKLDELRKLQELTKSSIRELPESPYFETRFFAGLKSSKHTGSKFRKYIPAIGFTMLAAVLMLILKFNPYIIDNLVEEQKTNIASFYKENLRPLLYAANLTNEDIFNFAFSNQIPLDEKENQVLQLGYDESGKEFFEIRRAAATAPSESNLERFVTALKLNDEQRKQVDSILDSYADDLQTQILVNDKNTLAINPNLWNYNKAIAAELLAFASSTNNTEFRKMIPVSYSLPKKGELKQYVSEVKTSRDNEYIFFTPDSIFSEEYEFDKGRFHVEIERMRKDIDKEVQELEKEMNRINIDIKIDSGFNRHKKGRVDKNFKIYVDSNSCRVMVPVVPMPKIKLPELDSLNIYLDGLSENLKEFSFRIQTPDHPKAGVYNFQFNDSLHNFNFNMPGDVQVQGLDSLLNEFRVDMDSLKLPDMNYYFNTDSLSSMLRFFMNDSLNFFNHEEFKLEMEELEKEMKQFREEMKEMRKDLNKDTLKEKKKTTVNDPIEI